MVVLHEPMRDSCYNMATFQTSACLIWIPCEILIWARSPDSSSYSEDPIPIDIGNDNDVDAVSVFAVASVLKTNVCGAVCPVHTAQNVESLRLTWEISVNLSCDMYLSD